MHRKIIPVTLYTLVLFFSFIPRTFAIYSWVDENGVYHISDYPKPGASAEREIKEEKAAPAAQPEAPVSVPVPEDTAPAPERPQGETRAEVSSPVPTPMTSPVPSAPLSATVPTIMQAPVASSNAGTTPFAAVPSLPSANAMPRGQVDPALLASFAKKTFTMLLVLYFYLSLCLYLIARKLELQTAWTAWVPIIQVIAFLESAGKPLWWFLLFFIPFVNGIVAVYLWMCIAENLGKNKFLGLLTLIPLVNFLVMGVLAFSKKEGREGSPLPI